MVSIAQKSCFNAVSSFEVQSATRIKKVVCDSLKLNEEEAKPIEFSLLDLTSDHGWKVAMNDCTYVMHVPSPFRIANPKNANNF